MIVKAVLTFPYSKVQSKKEIRVNLDGKDCILEEGKHFRVIV